jgi:hypothetical protein
MSIFSSLRLRRRAKSGLNFKYLRVKLYAFSNFLPKLPAQVMCQTRLVRNRLGFPSDFLRWEMKK